MELLIVETCKYCMGSGVEDLRFTFEESDDVFSTRVSCKMCFGKGQITEQLSKFTKTYDEYLAQKSGSKLNEAMIRQRCLKFLLKHSNTKEILLKIGTCEFGKFVFKKSDLYKASE